MIEVGEYIRTRKGITKIKKTSKECSLCENSLIVNNETHKHSKNIIDLIEVGDIVNGCRVMSVLYLKGKKENRVANFKLIDGQTYTGEIDYEGKKRKFSLVVKTILTHELYEQNCYKVVE